MDQTVTEKVSARHVFSRTLTEEQRAFVRQVLEHPCFENEDYVSLRAVHMRNGTLRITFTLPWEYKKTFYVKDCAKGNPRMALQLDIYAEYTRAFDEAMREADEVDGSTAWDAQIDWQHSLARTMGPLELRAIIAPYVDEIEAHTRQSANIYEQSKCQTADGNLLLRFDATYSVFCHVVYMRYQGEGFSIIYSDGKTRIEINTVIPQSAANGGTALTTEAILGPGLGRDVQRVFGIEVQKKRTRIRVETITCLVCPARV